MKYNVPLDLESDNSLKLINDLIRNNSRILEFGPANGRLTRYLSEKKQCVVDIVEIDSEAGMMAKRYAKIALVGPDEGNIENYKWAETLSGTQYDYIVFADVLEHLYNPKKVLKACVPFLKENGSILLSVPNIAHASVMLELLDNHFDYTRVGLLDDTHIRFVTYDTLKELLRNIGLITVYENATRVEAGSKAIINEIPITYRKFNHYDMEVIKDNEFGNCFQYIFEIKRYVDYKKKPVKRVKKLIDKHKVADITTTKYMQKLHYTLELNEKIQQINANLRATQLELDILKQSKSWKITRPLRYVGSKVRYLKNLLKKAPKNQNVTNEKDGPRPQNAGYYSLYQNNEALICEHNRATVKALAFYLPQYHTFPENDQWWGKGFTEWTNVKKGRPRFKTHYQPRVPHVDIGYYDLTMPDNLKQQAKLAKEHGIYGFCIYYYWFSGHRLMENPLDLLLQHPEIDLNYCLCWANENWTRTWDGLDKDILIQQNYTEQDRKSFITDLKKYLEDSRYIKLDGKPVVIVYNLGKIPDPVQTLKTWKSTAFQEGIGDISIWSVKSFSNLELNGELSTLVDRVVEFPPFFDNLQEIQGTSLYTKEVAENGHVFNYSDIVDKILSKRNYLFDKKEYKLYRAVMLGWDNSARRKNGYTVYGDFDLGKYYSWLKADIIETIMKYPPQERFVFINAWNEWGEGTYLEPDEKYGYASINATACAIQNKNLEFTVKKTAVVKSRIAVQVHAFYVDVIAEIINYTNNINEPFDLFITTDSMKKLLEMSTLLKNQSNAVNISVMIVENRGRDVMPFLLQMHDKIYSYTYFLHLHTKKSLHSSFGEQWRHDIFSKITGSQKRVNDIITAFDENNKLGMFYPSPFELIDQIDIGGDKIPFEILGQMISVPLDASVVNAFPVGDMFWGRTEAFKQLFDFPFEVYLFPCERQQIDGTIMHAIERAWVQIAEYNQFECVELS